MIRFIENVDLSNYNTFNIACKADYFFEFTESDDLLVFLENYELPQKQLILGGGSNLLLTNDFKGIVLYPNVQGIIIVDETHDHVFIEVGAGVVWDDFVEYCVNRNLGGIENLSLIPGNVGAAPIQNVGAYGAEAKDCIEHVRAVDLINKERVEFTKEECLFGYRDSVFKGELKGRIVVTSVLFKLHRFPKLNIDYGDVAKEIQDLGDVNLQNIRKAIVKIRESKLPNTNELGNAGSFFKNPVVDKQKAEQILAEYPDAPVYQSSENGKQKLAAGWLIDRCGLKGYRRGDAAVHEKQALVLVNHGKASGSEILQLSEYIQQQVKNKFGVELEREVNLVE